jgi:hypothetical protein
LNISGVVVASEGGNVEDGSALIGVAVTCSSTVGEGGIEEAGCVGWVLTSRGWQAVSTVRAKSAAIKRVQVFMANLLIFTISP